MILPGGSKEGNEENAPALWLTRLDLHDFRNYSHAVIEVSPGVNLVSGQNAQGKTSLLEAISLVSTGRLLRGSKDALAIRHECDIGKVSGTLGESGTEIGITLRRGVRKRVELNGMSLPRPSDLIGRLPTVSFSASDLCIVTGEPSDRRQFLDWELAQLYPSYLKNLTVYKRAVEHRNALLRQAQESYVPDDVFEPWELQIAAAGSSVREMRRQWTTTLGSDASKAHAELSSGERLTLSYQPRDDAEDTDAFVEKLTTTRGTDISRGATTVGPHRDELLIEVNEQEARYFGSQGQQRTAVIALKLATLVSAENLFRTPPVLLLDDVFSDLDQGRRNLLMHLTLDRGGQVFLTCTEVSQAGADLVDRSKIFQVNSGHVVAL